MLDDLIDVAGDVIVDDDMAGDEVVDGRSMAATCMTCGGSVILLLNSGIGIRSASIWKISFGRGGSGFS